MKKNAAIGNRKTGETLTMLVSEEDNGGTLQQYRVLLPAKRQGPPLHYHLAFAETFTVEEGTLDFYLGRERRHIVVNHGESVTAAPLQLHTFANHSSDPCTMIVETKPAGGVVRAFQLAYAVANDGGAAKDGLPKNPLIRLRFIAISQGFLSSLPLAFQRTVFAVAAFLAKVTGVERRVNRYLNAG